MMEWNILQIQMKETKYITKDEKYANNSKENVFVL